MAKSAHATPESSRSGYRRRARRACVPCRLSKVKCEGKEPCSRCEERGLMCVLGVDRREIANRKPLLRTSPEKRANQEDHQPEFLGSKEQANLLDHEVSCSISGSDAAASSTMQLHYGPSSTFVFMQQLHRLLVGDLASNATPINGRSANYTAEAVSEFGYNSIFFGRVLSSDGDTATHTAAQAMSSSPIHPEQLPFDLAANFLDVYLSSLHYAIPFCEPATLRQLVYTWYSTMNSRARSSRDSTLVIAVFAVGATLTDHTAWADSLFSRARMDLDSWGDAVNLRSVQILMLLSEFHSIRGRPNSAILALGSAVHKALAIGLHHEISSPEPHQARDFIDTDRSRAQERYSTFWALYARDRYLSLSVGRPASINDMDVDVSDPTGDRNLEAMVTLSRVSNKIYYGIYGRKKGSVAGFCRKVQEIRDELLCYHDSLAPEIQLPLHELDLKVSVHHLTTAQMILACDFYQTMIIALRPCLVLGAVRRRNAATNSGDSAPVIPVEWLPWLDAASQLCTKISKHIIYLFASAIGHNPLISRMRHSRFFLEGACFVLLFDILRDPTRDECDQSFQAVAEALQCFARLPTDRLILISTSAITNILQLTKDVVARHKSSSSQHIAEESPLLTQHLAAVATNFPNCFDDMGMENADFFNDEIFDLSYYLWTEDGAPTDLAW